MTTATSLSASSALCRGGEDRKGSDCQPGRDCLPCDADSQEDGCALCGCVQRGRQALHARRHGEGLHLGYCTRIAVVVVGLSLLDSLDWL